MFLQFVQILLAICTDIFLQFVPIQFAESHLKDLLLNDLLLPGYGDGSTVEFCVEILVALIQVHPLHRRKLLNVQNILKIVS